MIAQPFFNIDFVDCSYVEETQVFFLVINSNFAGGSLLYEVMVDGF